MIQLTGIQRRFAVGEQSVHALDNISLTCGEGDYISVMGPSGSGKSTLLNILGLLDRPDLGSYLLAGQDTTDLNELELARTRREHIGFVFQFFHLIPRLSATENVELPMILAGMPTTERKERVESALADLGLSDRAHHRPDQLSGGQRQRVAIARATIMRPRLLLADEPTGNLDRASGREVIRILEELNHQGITLILVTHDPELGDRAGRRLRMLDGHIGKDSALDQ